MVYNTGPDEIQQPIRFIIPYGLHCPYVLQSTQVYGLQFELKAKAGKVKQEHAQQSIK